MLEFVETRHLRVDVVVCKQAERPGHGHADALSVELWYDADGDGVVDDPGDTKLDFNESFGADNGSIAFTLP